MRKHTKRSDKKRRGLVIVLLLTHLGQALCEQMRGSELIVAIQY